MNNETLKRELCARLMEGVMMVNKEVNKTYFNPLILKGFRDEDSIYLHGLSLPQKLSNHAPILFPTSALTKPIQIASYNNGEPFVPLRELHRLNELNEFSKNKEMLRRIFVDTVISCDFTENDGSTFSSDYAQLKYTVDTNMGTLIYSFGYNATMRRFDARDETHKRPLGVAYQLDMFDLLNRWHINYRLSPDQFIEVTDEFNPYI